VSQQSRLEAFAAAVGADIKAILASSGGGGSVSKGIFQVDVATTANITLSGTPQTIDGYAAVAGDTVLVKDQTAPAQNGIYTVSAGAWLRHIDFDTMPENAAVVIGVKYGNINTGQTYKATVSASGTLGTTALTYERLVGDRTQDVVSYATMGPITLSGPQTVDGYSAIAGNWVLVKDQANPAENGVYIVQSGAWVRHPSYDTGDKLAGRAIRVRDGSVNYGTRWQCISWTNAGMGTDPITFRRGEALYGANTSAVVISGTTEAAVTGSGIVVPLYNIRPGSQYRLSFDVNKGANGAAAPSFKLRYGTAGTLSDPVLITWTLGNQTAVADQGRVDIMANFRAVGANALITAALRLTHEKSTTGLSTVGSQQGAINSAAFNSNVHNAILWLSVIPGTAAVWTLNVVQAELTNLA
jgi:hypothetical protein